jgi:primosomal protein N' (replication factor Y)
MSKFVRVAVNIAQIYETFDYRLPPALETQVIPGSLVVVPFNNHLAQGIIVKDIEEPAVPNPFDVQDLVIDDPVVTPWQIKLAEDLAEQNFSPLSEYLFQMLPPGLAQQADILVHLQPDILPQVELSETQNRILTLLQKNGDLRGRQIEHALSHTHWRESLTGLKARGLVTTQSFLRAPTVTARTIRTAVLTCPLDNGQAVLQERYGKRSGSAAVLARRQAVLTLLAQEGSPVDVSMIYAETGTKMDDLKALDELDLISLGESEFWRDPLRQMDLPLQSAPVLTAAQRLVWDALEPQFTTDSDEKINLLVGVTGSGKTEIYLRAVERTLRQGKGAIILVPEISLTPQTVRRFFARFPGKVALMHSGLSAGERFDTWRRVRNGTLTVVVGARSALFAPLPDPGLIVVDECHDGSYFQDDFRPHYSAVEGAIAYSRIANIPLLLGSATPATEQLYRARREKWHELHLPDRIFAHQAVTDPSGEPGTLPLPPVQVVDMRSELKAGNRSELSTALRRAISETLEREEQVILFLNRRGSATYVFCRDCGYVARCPRCSTQVTYHASNSALLCHICGYQRQVPRKCPDCGGTNIRQFGLGTEKLEASVSEEFPSARVLRWDADTAHYKGSHDLILDHFSQHRADILIGTQMVAKGLDLPLVTLVGVVLTDISLNLPDFHACEQTFQLLCQVAGRAGRSGKGGKAIFQTFHPENYAIRYASMHDLDGFYEEELALRKKTNYPPFCRLLRIEFRHDNEQAVQKAAVQTGEQLGHWLQQYSLNMIGPVPCFYSRRNGLFRWQILLRGWNFSSILKDHPLNTWLPRGIEVELTADPPSVL